VTRRVERQAKSSRVASANVRALLRQLPRDMTGGVNEALEEAAQLFYAAMVSRAPGGRRNRIRRGIIKQVNKQQFTAAVGIRSTKAAIRRAGKDYPFMAKFLEYGTAAVASRRRKKPSTRTYQTGSRAGQKYTLKMTRGRPAIAPKPFIQPAFEVSAAPASELIINAAADVVQKVVSRNAEPRI
jgi:HK97 gp10 family phage protein